MNIKSILALLAAAVPACIGSSTFQPRHKLQNLHSGPSHLHLSKHAIIGNLGGEAVTTTESDATFSDLNKDGYNFFVRGGDAFANPDIPKINELAGASFFIVLQVILNDIFIAKKIKFPAMMAATILVFTVLVLSEVILPGVGENCFQLLQPGANFLTKWLPVMFVPGLAMLPLAPSIGSAADVVKVLSMIVLGFIFTLSSTSFLVLGMRTAQGLVESVEEEVSPIKERRNNVAAAPTTPSPASKPFTEETMNFLLSGTVLAGAASIAATRQKLAYATPIRTIAMFFGSVFTYVFGARLPSSFTKIVHPLVTSTIGTLLLVQLDALATGSTFEGVLKTFRAGSLSPLKVGAGDLLLFLLGPSVGSFSVAMYGRKKILAENLAVVVAAMLCSSVGGLFGTAFFVRLLSIGSSALVRLSLITRNITTPLAIVITQMLEGDISIAASVVVLTGIFAATAGRSMLDSFKIQDPVSRGLGMGAAGQGLGVAAMAPEKEAFPFAAINMVMTAVSAVILASVPASKNALVNIVSGGLEIAE